MFLQLAPDIHHLAKQIMATSDLLYASTHVVRLQPLMYDITECLILMGEIKTKLDVLYGAHERIDFINTVSNQMYVMTQPGVTTLSSILHFQATALLGTMIALQNDAVVQTNSPVIMYVVVVRGLTSHRLISSVVHHLERATKWSETVESAVMMELEANVSSVERLTEYRTEVESKLLLLTMGGPPDQQQVRTINF